MYPCHCLAMVSNELQLHQDKWNYWSNDDGDKDDDYQYPTKDPLPVHAGSREHLYDEEVWQLATKIVANSLSRARIGHSFKRRLDETSPCAHVIRHESQIDKQICV